MRTIKFRVWDCDNESFSKIDFSDLERTIEELDSFRSYFSGDYFVGENYLQQFTGLLDKNGKEIYEGDILKFQTFGFEPETFITSILFNKDSFKLKNGRNLFYFGQKDLSSIDDAVIIGNIHETPELLNQN